MGWFCCSKNKEKKKVKEDDKDAIINCPRCDKPMQKQSNMGVTIDKCKKCQGIWLDGGEIESIVKRANKQKKTKKKA